MIKVPYIKVKLKQDGSTISNFVVPPHELALMRVRYGSKVKEEGLDGYEREVDTAEEFARLERVWGLNPKTSEPWVITTFGRLEEGRLESTMIKGAEHYTPEVVELSPEVVELSPQQKAANTRAAKKAAKAEEEDHENAEDTVAATG